MKRTKKCLALSLALSIILTILPSYATEGNKKIPVRVDYSSASQQEISKANIVVVDYTSLSDISSYAKDIIDSGKMLYIVAPQESLEDIAKDLSIPKRGISAYNDVATLFAYSIYNIGEDNYAFQHHYILSDEPSGDVNSNSSTSKSSQDLSPITKEQTSFQSANIIANDNVNLQSYIENNLLGAYESALSTTQTTLSTKNVVDPKMRAMPPAGGSPIIDTEILNVYGTFNNYLGYLSGTQWIYTEGKCIVDGKLQDIFNVISSVSAHPSATTKVTEYKVRMHCNIVGHTLLDSVSIPSGISKTVSLSVGTSLGSSGSSVTGGYGISWQYNPESQIIKKSSPTPRVIDWKATPVSPGYNDDYKIMPGIQVATTNSKGSRGTFTTMYCDSKLFGISLRKNSVEFGTWF